MRLRNKCPTQRVSAITCMLAVVWLPVAARAAATLEEVIVTAERRETSLQATPVAVTAFTGEDLRAMSAVNVTDVGRLTPNMFFKGGANSAGTANNAQIYLRGVGQTDFLPTSDPGVGLYLDDVYLGRSVGGVLTLPDMERIEVLRGPQGTLFGRNTIGGAVQVVTRKPVLGEFQSWAQITLGNDDWQKIEGALNVPLGATLAARFAFQHDAREGFGTSTAVPIDFGNEENATLRGQIKWQASEALDFLLAADYYTQNQNSMPAIAYFNDFTVAQSIPGLYNGFLPALTGARPFTPADLQPLGSLEDPYTNSATLPARDDNDTYGLALTGTWAVSDKLTVKSITSYRDIDAHYSNDADATDVAIGYTDEAFEQNQFSQELQLFGNAERLEWLLGFYYFHERAISDNTVPLVIGLFSALEGLPGAFIPLAPGVVCPAPFPAPCAGGPGNPFNVALDVGQRPHNDIAVTSYAGFGQGTWHFTERLSGTFGFRYSHEKKDFYTFNTTVESSQLLGIPIFLVPPTRRQASFNDFSPKVGIEFQASEDILLYANYSEGFRSGTFNGRAGAQRAVESVAPESVENYELGFKSEWFGRRARLNGAGFYTVYSDIQFISVEPDPAAGFIVFLRNADEAEVYGFELEGLASLTEDLLVYANVGHTHSEVTRIDALLSLTTGVDEGDQLRKAPEWTFAVGGQYTVHTALGNFVGRADWNWQDEVAHEASNNPVATEDSYGLLNLRLAWHSPDEQWEVAGFMRNATDETYFNSLFIQGGTMGVAYPARGREWGFNLRWQY
ncbi:MAG: TonB-dependent receptor [Gammaproteobacteria bacterium]|nr:TonB-dependent receptor [Gammaproteobacteria bacterium]